MGFFTEREKGKILTVVEHLISKSVETSVGIQGSDEHFSTKVRKVKTDDGYSSLIIDKLYPETGNSLIQSSPDLQFSFEMSGSRCAFATRYLGINTDYPEFGLLVAFPTSIQIEDRRKEKRVKDGLMKFLLVEFNAEGDDKLYQLRIINIGSSGIGFIVEKDDFDLFNKINVGDSIRDLRFSLPKATLTVDAEVKHMTRMARGKFKGSYLVGIESGFLVQLKALKDELRKKSDNISTHS
jgi:hypothetical protein